MAKVSKTGTSSSAKKMRPALSPEARENQLIALAVDCAEEQLRNGTASSQVITHYLKLATTKSKMEVEKLKQETALAEAKAKNLQAQENMEQKYIEAIKAMSRYSGRGGDDEDEEY